MRILSIDTCLAACSVAVLDGERVLAAISEPMVRGHQERLASMAREAMAHAGLRFGDLERIGVTVGPGSFTGLRVGLAFAKGLSSALARPAVGVGSLEALPGDGRGITAAVTRSPTPWSCAVGLTASGEGPMVAASITGMR